MLIQFQQNLRYDISEAIELSNTLLNKEQVDQITAIFKVNQRHNNPLA